MFPLLRALRGGNGERQSAVCPPNLAGSAALRKLGRVRTAILTGWAVDPNCRYRYQVDAAFPLSDHADFHDLLEFVRQVAPKKVFTLHGFAADFAQTLRDFGFDAQALSEEEQLALPLALASGGVQGESRGPQVSRPAPGATAVPAGREPTPGPSRGGDPAGFAEPS